LYVRIPLIDLLIESPQEGDRIQVFPPTVLVWNPFTFFSRIIQIQHGRDRIDPQSVDMILVEPEERATNQEGAYLIASVVEDIGVPVRMKALLGVRMLIQMCPIEITKSMRVGGKMRRHPVENDADTVLMQDIDQVHEVLRSAVVAGWRKIPGSLI